MNEKSVYEVFEEEGLVKYCLLMDIMMINNSLENKTPPSQKRTGIMET